MSSAREVRVLSRWREALAGVTPVAVLGTIVCCALPITLVTLGLGSVVASLVATAPWLVALSQHKAWVFLFAGLLLFANHRALYDPNGRACAPGGLCDPRRPTGRWLRRVFWGSVGIYAVAFFAAFLLVPVTGLLER
jgi:mercuric ion transport protein